MSTTLVHLVLFKVVLYLKALKSHETKKDVTQNIGTYVTLNERLTME